MLLTVDIGNSNIVFEFMDEYESVSVHRIETIKEKPAAAYAEDIKQILSEASREAIEAVLVSSVVADVCKSIKEAFALLGFENVLVAGENLKPRLEIKIDNPAEMGMDMVVGDIEAKRIAGSPVIVIDMGTATTISAVDESGACIGCSIIPGVRTALKALLAGTGLMSQLRMDRPEKFIGTNTEEALLSGSIYGSAAMLDGMIERMESEMACTARLVCSGGIAPFITPYCKRKDIIFVPNLIARGLVTIYKEK